MTTRWLPLTILLLVATCAGLAAAGDWPRFRGPNGMGMVEDEGIPVRWSATENVRWKTPLPGLGNSSPITWGERVFLQSASEDGRERWLLCLHADQGNVLWKRTVAGTKAHTHQKNSLASSTPATDGERVYAVFWDGKEIALHAFSFDGEALWQCPLGAFKSQHGPGMSPMVIDDLVVVANDQDGVATLVAVDAKTGDVRWQTPRKPYRACYSTPFMLHGDLVVGSTAGLSGYDPRTGTELWHWDWKFAKSPLRTVASPVAANGMIFANSGDGGGDRHTVAVKIDGHGRGAKLALAWESQRVFGYVPCMLVHGDHLFFVNDLGVAACHQAATGANVWTERLGGNFSASPIMVNGLIYAINEEGTTYVVPAAGKYELLARNVLDDVVLATPAAANGKLYVRGRHHLYCLGTK